MVDEAGLYGNAGNQYENPEGEKELSPRRGRAVGGSVFHLVAVRLHGLLVLEKIVHARYFLMRKETCMAEKLKIISLGGLNEIGKNLTVYEYGNDIIVIDCGMGFPDDDMYGIDVVIRT